MHKEEHSTHFKHKVGVDEPPKVPIIGRSNAIIQPVTVMVELLAAPIATSTVLSPLLHVGIADVAVEIHGFASVVPDRIKSFLLGFQFSLLEH